MERRLSLKKSVMVAGLILTLMLAAFVGVSMGSAHAAPAIKKSRISSAAMQSLKKASKSKSTCTTSSKFWINPCAEHETDTGGESFVLVGRHLIPNTTYIVWSPDLNTACSNTTLTSDGQNLGTGAFETTDFSGNLNVAVTATTCIARSKGYQVELELDEPPYTAYTTTFTVERP